MKDKINYDEFTLSDDMFRFFIRKQYPDIEIRDKDCDKLRIEFSEYLNDLDLNELQKGNILPKNKFDVIINLGNPLRMHGFPPAYVLHFTEFIDKMQKESNS